jgi:endonuclease G
MSWRGSPRFVVLHGEETTMPSTNEATFRERQFEVLQEASRRYEAHKKERDAKRRKLDKEGPLGANTPEQLDRRLERKRLNLRAAGVPAAAAELVAADRRGLERIIGANNLVGINYFDRALRAAGTVARIIVRDSHGQVLGFGTGFLVSPRLLLTNQHVLEDDDAARHSLTEFNYEDDEFGQPEASVRFELDPGAFFKASPYAELDYALIAVKELASDGTRLSRFRWNRLIGTLGKAVLGEPLNVIQHPAGEPKQLALRENLLLDILEDPPHFLHYGSDTLQGSSGSPVYNDEWEVVALHHRGVARTRNGQILRRDGRPATPETPDTEIDWVANEGVRTSAIVDDLRSRTDYRSSERGLIDELLKSGASPVEQQPAHDGADASDGSDTVELREGRLVRRFQFEVSLGFPTARSNGGATAEPKSPAAPQPESPAGGGLVVQELTLKPAHYADRKGYDEKFLGAKHGVPLPHPKSWSKDLAPVKGAPKDAPHVLRYTNFSVAMSKSRRAPVFTAVNIDGSKSQSLKRGTDAWYFDPRIARDHQVGNELYRNNPLDRGHMVRRLDPVWGSRAARANEDTFHYTNACPQHADLNQKTWNDLEDYILGNADTRNLRVSVLTGPVLRGDDRAYRSIKVPREFWKVVAMVRKSTGKLSVTAYTLSQAKMITHLEDFAYGKFRTYQVPVRRVEDLTGLDFGDLGDFDPLASSTGGGPLEAFEAAGRAETGVRLVRGASDLVL